jgi:hypothetical protein
MVHRGGDWARHADLCAVSYRPRGVPAHRINNPVGLRVARVADGNESTPPASAPQSHRPAWIEEKWVREVAALPFQQQVAAVKAMMPQRNPGLDGPIKPKTKNGVVTEIQFDGSAVQDLSPLLAFAGLQTLDCACKDPWQSPLADLSPLARLPLRSLRYPYHTWLGAEQLRSIKTLETINDQPAAAFWTKVDGEAAEFEIFCKLVAGLTPPEQEKAVSNRMKDRNPGFDGKWNAVIEKGKFVVELRFPTDAVVDISPVRALPGLQRLMLSTPKDKGSKLADLTPLEGMKLTVLKLDGCVPMRDLTLLQGMPLTFLQLTGCEQVGDLTPLKGMPLTSLFLCGCVQVWDLTPLQGMELATFHLQGTAVRDLTPLKGMPLTFLDLGTCRQVQDLTPLKGMPLKTLGLYGCLQVRDLTPLQGMKLTGLNLGGCEVQDLTPLQGMPLTNLALMGCDKVRDLTPLEGMPLELIQFKPKNIVKGIEGIRRMESMKTIITNDRDPKQYFPAGEFWKKYDAKEFSK